MRLDGRVAAIFGGANGIGAATAQLFAHRGAGVAVVDLDGQNAQQLADELAGTGVPTTAWTCDVSDERRVGEVVEAIVDAHGRLDIAVLSVFADRRLPITELERGDWDRTLAVTLSSAYAVAHACLPSMRDSGGGSLVFISSVQARFGLPGAPAYSAAKAGLCGLARQLAVEYGSWGIRVNAILPSAVLVDRNRDRWGDDDQARRRGIALAFPLGRIGRPEDVAQAALFLASDASAFITGIELPVDGGLSACPATRPLWEPAHAG